MAPPSGRVTGEERLRARRLKNLSTISAWRGEIVDKVISEHIIPELDFDDRVTLGQAKTFAKGYFDKQRHFAEAHRNEDLSLVKSHYADEFLLLYEYEYGPEPTDVDFERAWQEIETALNNLYSLDGLRRQITGGTGFFAQERLYFDILDDLNGVAYPDLIVYSQDAPIQIIDWKVHAEGANDARSQLASYAIALSRMKKPNRDFPTEHWQAPASEIVLKEVQLLLGDVREHQLTDSDLEEAEVHMMTSAFEMSEILEGKKFEDSDIGEFDVARNPELCESCSFRLICWEESKID
jgi:hypothetical protein